ncbi:transposase (fragment) [Xenorhabdus bovienii str. feltiae Florida]
MQISAGLPKDLQGQWPSVHSLIEVVSERGEKGEIHRDSRWYISSLPLEPEVAAKAESDQTTLGY